MSSPRWTFEGVSRWQAAGLHLAGSAIIGLFAFAMMRLAWYPGEYFRLGGAGTLIMLLVAVDIVPGPLCTLIVFKPGKPGLKMDLVLIVAVQLAALIYGTTVTFQARPVYAIHVVDQFKVVSAAALPLEQRALARHDEFRILPIFGPKIAGAIAPTDPGERTRAIFAALAGTDLEQLPMYWVPYDQVREQVLARAMSLNEARRLHPGNSAVIDQALVRLGRSGAGLMCVGVRARFGEALMLVDAKTAEPVTMIDARW